MVKKPQIDNELEKKLIYYLELRHLLVHNSGVIDDHFIGATEKMNANLGNYKIGDKIELNESDWIKIKKSYINLVEIIISKK